MISSTNFTSNASYNIMSIDMSSEKITSNYIDKFKNNFASAITEKMSSDILSSINMNLNDIDKSQKILSDIKNNSSTNNLKENKVNKVDKIVTEMIVSSPSIQQIMSSTMTKDRTTKTP